MEECGRRNAVLDKTLGLSTIEYILCSNKYKEKVGYKEMPQVLECDVSRSLAMLFACSWEGRMGK